MLGSDSPSSLSTTASVAVEDLAVHGRSELSVCLARRLVVPKSYRDRHDVRSTAGYAPVALLDEVLRSPVGT